LNKIEIRNRYIPQGWTGDHKLLQPIQRLQSGIICDPLKILNIKDNQFLTLCNGGEILYTWG